MIRFFTPRIISGIRADKQKLHIARFSGPVHTLHRFSIIIHQISLKNRYFMIRQTLDSFLSHCTVILRSAAEREKIYAAFEFLLDKPADNTLIITMAIARPRT